MPKSRAVSTRRSGQAAAQLRDPVTHKFIPKTAPGSPPPAPSATPAPPPDPAPLPAPAPVELPAPPAGGGAPAPAPFVPPQPATRSPGLRVLARLRQRSTS